MIVTRPTIPASRFAERLRAARGLAERTGLSAVLVGVGADMRYFCGYAATPLERLTMLAIPANGDPILVVPRLEAAPARLAPPVAAGLLALETWDEGGDAYALVASVVRAATRQSSPATLRIAVSDDLPARHLLPLEERLGDPIVSLASGVLRDIRMIKDPDEIALLTLAAQAADRVVTQIAAGRLVGRTESDVAREVRERLLAEGHDEAHFAIVGSGPNSASPHHEASDRVIQAGEPIVLDIGGVLGGYGSDTTRTLWVTGGDPANGPTDDFRTIHELVRAANAAATRAVAPGAACEQLDEIARRVIRDGGYGDAFIHRLGHGIGLDGHEDPYLVADSRDSLAPGMAFSIEPGIYLQDRFGVRIEDIVVCGAGGPDVLNEAPRELLVVDG